MADTLEGVETSSGPPRRVPIFIPGEVEGLGHHGKQLLREREHGVEIGHNGPP